MLITIPEMSLIVLIGASSSGKSTFAHHHFHTTEIVSSDFCRALICDDETNQSVTQDAFEILHSIVAKRLAQKRLTVIDATNVQAAARKSLLQLAQQYHYPSVAMVFNIAETYCQRRHQHRLDRHFEPQVIQQHYSDLRQSLSKLKQEGFQYINIFNAPAEIEVAQIRRLPLSNNLTHDSGPFDIIGDVHGCFEELVELLQRLGYRLSSFQTPDLSQPQYSVTHPQGRRVIFLGDLVDRGPKIPAVLRLVMDMVADGSALCILGNHEAKLARKLNGKNVQLTHGLAESIHQLTSTPTTFQHQVTLFIDNLIEHYQLDKGKLVVAHAGLTESLQGRVSGQVREFALYGKTTGETDEWGLPVRENWAATYQGRALVVYGHTPVAEAQWLNRTVCIDTGCVFGGKLTALRYPETELVTVAARATYRESIKPFLATDKRAPPISETTIDDTVVEPLTPQRSISTRLNGEIVIQPHQASKASEQIEHSDIHPNWLIYLPPKYSPPKSHQYDDWLEHPAEALSYYQQQGVHKVLCQKHFIGTTAIIIVCRHHAAVQQHFGIETQDTLGSCYTRYGQRFFADLDSETAFLARIHQALTQAGFWEDLQTDWLALEAELITPQTLLQQQWALMNAVAHTLFPQILSLLDQAHARDVDTHELQQYYQTRTQALATTVEQNCPQTPESIAELKLVPLHILATEGQLYWQKTPIWQVKKLTALSQQASDLIQIPPYHIIDFSKYGSQKTCIRWWSTLNQQADTAGIIVKPFSVLRKGQQGWIQPALYCRGREYLRLIYGPEYTLPEQLTQLRTRTLTHQRQLAINGFALGIEALERFVHKRPRPQIQECILALLALEQD
ncbi:MAG: polynucleotide kinase-phosphatase [Pseudomonadota bacterium]|nr:polynucleotide kinase-phosphatase [Pseudomonadota bacterium]